MLTHYTVIAVMVIGCAGVLDLWAIGHQKQQRAIALRTIITVFGIWCDRPSHSVQ
jgi:hypothetical protein